MCGIVGFINNNSKDIASKSILKKMVLSLNHRGPDSSGIWFDEEEGIFLGHARLSIIDLSSAGHQPMQSLNSRYIISFNGEIYNHRFMRDKVLDKNPYYKFNGSSDTESLLAFIENYSIKDALENAEGMFAIAIWDKKNKELTLARDKVGEKPLYYGFQKGTLLFASELQALKFHSSFKNETDINSVEKFLKLSYVPQPYSIYKDIFKLRQGSYLKFTSSHIKRKQIPETKKYWDYKDITKENYNNSLDLSFDDALKIFEKKLELSVDQMMISDVPIGSFLSGGIDSSLITALMQKNSSSKIKTFSIGFNEEDYNESHYAKKIANYLNTDHHEFVLDSSYALDHISNMHEYFDEPFGDSSALPTFLITKLAKSHIGVAISGDGCDELFGGYNRYHRHRIMRLIQIIPVFIRKKLFKFFNYNQDLFISFLSFISTEPQIKIRFIKAIQILDCKDIEELYQRLIIAWEAEFNFKKLIDKSYIDISSHSDKSLDFLKSEEKMMYEDFMEYLPDDILVKVDRASMQNSLEVRVPYLNSDLIEFSCSLPLKYKINSKKGKLLPRKLLSSFVPDDLFERPKQGFAIPLDSWLRGPLKDWASDIILLKNSNLYINDQELKKVWDDFLLGKNNEASGLWNVLMYKSWSQG